MHACWAKMCLAAEKRESKVFFLPTFSQKFRGKKREDREKRRNWGEGVKIG